MPEWCDRRTLLGLIAATALLTYLLRVVPLVLLRRPLRNPYFVALLEYMPYALLTALGCETREGNVTYSRAMETVEANRQYLSESALAVYESLLNE